MRTSFSLVTACLLVSTASADGPAPRADFADTVRAAVAASRVADSGNLSRADFRDVASDGSVLVGLEVGLGRWFDREIPYAIRPIFRKGDTEWVGGTAGSFASRQIVRVMQVAARPGYAVGGIWLRTGAWMDRLCLVFFKITPDGLDPADTYTSPWVGTSDGGSDHYVDGKGRPVVGLTADAGRDQVRTLGFVTAQVPPVAKKAEPKSEPAPKADTKDEPKKVDPPASSAEPAAPRKLRLQEEVAPPEEEEDNGFLLLVLAASVVVGAPVGIFAIVSLTKPAPLPDDFDDDDDRPRPRRPRRPGAERRRPADEGPDRDRPQPQAPAPAAATTERPELARRLAPYVPAKAAASGADAVVGPAPPWFLVRATYRSRFNRMTRIYVLPTEILMIDCGPGADVSEAAGLAAAVLSGGGVIGSVIGGAVGGMVADAGKAKGEAIQQRLNRLDLRGLLDLAGARGNLRAGVSDLVGVSIDPPSVSSWRGQPSPAVGTFRFRFLGRGEYTFEFLNGAEIRGAVELLRKVLGPAVHVGEGWDEATAVYLQGV